MSHTAKGISTPACRQAGGSTAWLGDWLRDAAPPAARSAADGAASLPCQRVTTQPDEKPSVLSSTVQDSGERLLTGSQAKTAFALRMNAEKMISTHGLNCSGFLTLTVGDYICFSHGKQLPQGKSDKCPLCRNKMLFKQCFDFDEASRRINSLASHFLKEIFSMLILVSERHKNGAIHFHALGVLREDCDIRTGFDFDALERRDYSCACPELKKIWAVQRDALPRYGFGRAQLTPIRKTAEAVASYVSKYIEKNILNRPAMDKGRKLVRYLGWRKEQLKPNDFEWNTQGANNWREKVRQCLRLAGVSTAEGNSAAMANRILEFCAQAKDRIRPKICDWSQAKMKFGSRWAYVITGIMRQVWGDDCDRLHITPNTLLKAIDLLDEAKYHYDKAVLEGFRWMKGLCFDLIRSDDSEQGRRDWWQTEFEADGMKLDDDFWTSFPRA